MIFNNFVKISLKLVLKSFPKLLKSDFLKEKHLDLIFFFFTTTNIVEIFLLNGVSQREWKRRASLKINFTEMYRQSPVKTPDLKHYSSNVNVFI